MHRFTHAIVRTPAPTFADGITTVVWSEPPSHARLLAQHAAYVETLRTAGLDVELLPPLPVYPDAYFVEDVAVVVPELAVLTRPGADARRGEVEFMRQALARARSLASIEAPATLDGGDVLIVEQHVFVGLSARTNAAGVEALAMLLRPHGYVVTAVPVAAGLHLKSSVNLIGPNLLLMAPGLDARDAFANFEILELAPEHSYAANALWINDHLLIAAGFLGLHARLRERIDAATTIVELDMREVEAMDGGLSCLSLRF